jgi:pimeloyl-ACP methyl ester carboxylesterase
MTATNPVLQRPPDPTAGPEVVLHLIHGTWSDGGGWVKKGTPFRDFLEKQFGDEVRINTIAWSSHNDDADRRKAKVKIIEDVKNAVAPGVQQFLIGHSHGGNVAVYAAADPEISQLLRGVVCLNTPFICTMPREFIFRWIMFIFCLSFGPISLLTDHLLQLAAGPSNDLIRLVVTVVVVSFGLGTIVTLLKPLAAKARRAAKRFEFPRADTVDVLALASGEDEALSGLGLLENIASLFRLLQHPIVVVLVAIATLPLMAAHLLPSPIVPGWNAWAVSECWTYALGYMLLLGLLEALASAACWRIGLGLSWREFPMGSALLIRVALSPVPLNFGRVELRCLELEGKSILAHCRIYDDREAQAKVTSWIAARLEARGRAVRS